MPVDKKTAGWLKSRVPKNKKINRVAADKDARYEKVLKYDVSRLRPQIACPHNVDNVVSVDKLKDAKINQVFLGTCTNGRLTDLKIAARILESRKIASGIKFIVACASRQIFLEALKLGIIDVFIKAGAVMVPPGCGPCVGTHCGIPADKEVVLSTANRNFKGRMGNPKAFIYLASPATVSASAIEGRIADPRKYL
jgi:3-isopropylmalate/(R)-2-methylmalate dehydratase large subunit